jgi:hypothetical protein
MTMVALAGSRVKSRLEAALPRQAIDQLVRDSGHPFRCRKLSPGLSVHLLLVQLLHKTALHGLRHFHDASLTASAICQARARLPLSLFYALIEALATALTGTPSHIDQGFHGLEVVLLDATSVRTADTPALAAHYGKHTNGRRLTPGYPAPKLLCLMHYATGLITRAIDLPACRQEHLLLRRLGKFLRSGQIVVADRGLVSFPFLCQLRQLRVQACLRLPYGQIAGNSPGRRILRTLGPGDLLVEWVKSPRRRNAAGRTAYAALPDTITLRQITHAVARAGFRTHTITLITTLLDASEYPACDLAELYLRRWQVEVYFRDLKRTQGCRHLAARTLAGARKELLAHVLLYNLIRAVMAEAAQRQNVPAHRVSFSDALRHLRHADPARAEELLVINRPRTRPGEPRRIKTRRAKYPPLNQPRATYKLQPQKQAA